MSLITRYAFNERGDLTKARPFETMEEIKSFLGLKYCGGSMFGSDELVRSGHYKECAISYNFRPFLTRYLIQTQYGDLQSGWAPSKGALRRAMHLTRNDKVFIFPKA